MQRKRLWIVVAAVAVVVVVGGAGGAYYVLRTKGSPKQTARAFVSAWQRGDIAAMRTQVAAPPADFEQQYRALAGIGVSKVRVDLGAVRKTGGHAATAPYSAALTVPSGDWRYKGGLKLTTKDRMWKVAWSPEAIHPDLHAGQQLKTASKWPRRGRVLAADGSAIDGAGTPGSVQQIVGVVAPATASDTKRLGLPYHKGDPAGRGGIQQRFERRLAGTPTTVISTTGGRTVGTLAGTSGHDVRSTLDPRIQRAASNAVRNQTKPTSLVALRAGTGQVLAVANMPGGFDRAMEGIYPPGSTFKVVTAYALLQHGLSPSSQVDCPKTAKVGGQTIHNSEGHELGRISFKEAFAQSCNTAFALQTKRLLNPVRLSEAAQSFGFNQKIDPGVRARPGSFPTPQGDAELAVAGFGQARDLANALTMAGVAAGAASGDWHPPTVVSQPRIAQRAKKLDSRLTGQLGEMMRAVVTTGTAKDSGLPPGTAGKTGTAEYGSGKKPPAHAWFMGYRGDVAFAVVVEGGGFGAKKAAPIAAAFLKSL